MENIYINFKAILYLLKRLLIFIKC